MYSNLTLKELIKQRYILDIAIENATSKHRELTKSLDINKYVECNNNFLPTDSIEFAGISADLENLGLHNKVSDNDDTKSVWLTSTNQSYIWKSKSKIVTKKPINISDSEFINTLCKDLNEKFHTNLNSCLVNYYRNGNSGVRIHDDDEESMDETQPICVLTVGDTRKVEFLHQYQSPSEKAIFEILPVSGSLYTMKPGCQSHPRPRYLSSPSTINQHNHITL